ncbi:hypothetical protein JCM19376_18090 [Fusibacter bizertensis]
MENFQYFKKYHPAVFESTEDGGTVYIGVSDKPWIYFDFFNLKRNQSIDILTRLLKKTPSSYSDFALIEDWMLPLIDPNNERIQELHCNRYQLEWNDYLEHYDSPNVFKADETGQKIVIEPLTIEDADTIQNSHDYKEYTDIAYVRKRIEMGAHAGIRIENNLIAWAITHDDGAIGFLFVNPSYRGRGYGKAIILKILDALETQGLRAYVHVEAENEASLSLFKGLGFKFDRGVRWFTMPK